MKYILTVCDSTSYIHILNTLSIHFTRVSFFFIILQHFLVVVKIVLFVFVNFHIFYQTVTISVFFCLPPPPPSLKFISTLKIYLPI